MKYATLCKKKGANKRVEELLDKAIVALAEDYKRIWEAFPDSGLGDTACGEATVKEIYEAIHYRL